MVMDQISTFVLIRYIICSGISMSAIEAVDKEDIQKCYIKSLQNIQFPAEILTVGSYFNNVHST